MKNILIVGAGLTGACLARVIAEAGLSVEVIDERGHVAGNCHTEADRETGIMTHKYGSHIFHTGNPRVWDFVNRFSSFEPYIHRVKTTYRGQVYSMPINLHTINQLFGLALSPSEAKKFISEQALSIADPGNFEEQALCLLGEKLYQAFFYGYTLKQWGMEPKELPAWILKRLPVRFNYDDNYFNHKYQGLPTHGYTAMVENMLDAPNIRVTLNTSYNSSMKDGFDHVFYSGPLDRYFEYRHGRLPYRTLDFECFCVAGDFQGCPVMNYADRETPYTRIVEHKHFTPWLDFDGSLCFKEYSRDCGPGDIPYYPVHFAAENNLLEEYQQLAARENRVTFVGRLGSFKYLDMDMALDAAMEAATRFLTSSGE